MPRTKKRKLGGTKKTARLIISSDEDSVLANTDQGEHMTEEKTKKGKRALVDTNIERAENARILSDLRYKLKKSEAERKRTEEKLGEKKNQLRESKESLATKTKALDRIKKEKVKVKRTNEKLEKEKENLEASGKKMKKKMEGFRAKINEYEVEKAKLESRLAGIQLKQSTSQSQEGAVGGADGGLFRDMMDNFRELAETQLQCGICTELFVDAVSINCGHTFCDYCITEWRKKKNNCPVCRTNIKAANPCKVLDEYSDKVYEQFVSEGGKQARAVLKEDRAKLKAEAEKSKTTKSNRRVLDRILDFANDSDASIDSNETLEIRFNSDFDSDGSGFLSDEIDQLSAELPRSPPLYRNLWANIGSDTDSSDSDFNVVRWDRRNRNRVPETSSSSSSSSDSSSDSDSDSD